MKLSFICGLNVALLVVNFVILAHFLTKETREFHPRVSNIVSPSKTFKGNRLNVNTSLSCWLVVAIPTVHRSAGVDYLSGTLNRWLMESKEFDFLLSGFSSQRKICIFIVNNSPSHHPAFDTAALRLSSSVLPQLSFHFVTHTRPAPH
eukprot:TRINITY_DN2691_c0_g1_i4.p2 TRINITY_DN2691_c0_g1~~TRINITY_DN2691_c0_g1_i4.p2  ORF type:complete len:148 (-),score=1.14 TRINITY_DN2691_c0_g1_i4:676-1119(-)